MINGFQAHAVKYHRNGIGGRSFWTVYFSCMLTDFTPAKFMPNMMAVLPADSRDLVTAQAETFVVDLNDRTECWRGENFFELVHRAIEKNTSGG